MGKIDFDKKLSELDKILEEMESGKLSIDQSLERYKTAIDIFREVKKEFDSRKKTLTDLNNELERIVDGNE